MSTENIPAFHDKVQASAELQARIAEIHHQSTEFAADHLAQLATEIGMPFTAEEFLASISAELTEDDLATVAGGGNVIVKKEEAPGAFWGLIGKKYYYTTDSGERVPSGKNYDIGDTMPTGRRVTIR